MIFMHKAAMTTKMAKNRCCKRKARIVSIRACHYSATGRLSSALREIDWGQLNINDLR
jgi:hypothetical protein